jgi:hypothetical protein
MMRLHPGAVAIISWEPDCSPAVMTASNIFSRPLWEPLDWDNGQPEHTCDWDCLCIPCPLPPVLFSTYLIAHVCTPKMAEDGVSAYSASSQGMSPAM